MGKQVTANKIDNGNGNASNVTLADFINNPFNADNNPSGIKIDQLSDVDQVTAKLVLQSIESAKKQGIADEQKRVEREREERLQEIRLSALNRDFWSVKGENSLYHHWNITLNGMIQSTLPVFMLPSGIPWAFFSSPDFEFTGDVLKDEKGNDIHDKDGNCIDIMKDISKRVIVRQFADFWIDFRVTLHHGIKPADKKRGRQAKTPEIAVKK